jgi:Ca2+-binding RTX toxin-like protein
LAFTTTPGTGGAPDSFVGTAGVDAITLVGSTTNFFVGAQGDNDSISFLPENLFAPLVVSNGTVRAGAGDDLIASPLPTAIFNNVLFNGNKGNDTILLNGAIQGSSIFGGEDNDNIEIGALIDGESPVPTVPSVIVSTLVNGNKGEDEIEILGFVQNSSIRGGQGGDEIEVEGIIENTLISGDLGDDEIVILGSVENSFINGGDGDDLIVLNADIEDSFIEGGDGDDLISSNGIIVDSAIDGGDGEDAIYVDGSEGSLIAGGEGDDLIDVDGFITDTWVLGEGGDDTIFIGEESVFTEISNSVIDGGDGDDGITLAFITGSEIDVFGGEGDDIIDAANAGIALTLYGNDGNDNLIGSNGSTLIGGTGADTLTATGGDSTLYLFATGDSFAATDSEVARSVTFGNGVDFITAYESQDVITLNGFTIAGDLDAVTGSATINGDGEYEITSLGGGTNTTFHINGTYNEVTGVFTEDINAESFLLFQVASAAVEDQTFSVTSVEAYAVNFEPIS